MLLKVLILTVSLPHHFWLPLLLPSYSLVCCCFYNSSEAAKRLFIELYLVVLYVLGWFLEPWAGQSFWYCGSEVIISSKVRDFQLQHLTSVICSYLLPCGRRGGDSVPLSSYLLDFKSSGGQRCFHLLFLLIIPSLWSLVLHIVGAKKPYWRTCLPLILSLQWKLYGLWEYP